VSLYKTDINDLTLTFVESRRPEKLIEHLTKKRNFTVEKNGHGIYIVKGDVLPIQIINNRKLSTEENVWLKDLDNQLDARRVRRLLVFREHGYGATVSYAESPCKWLLKPYILPCRRFMRECSRAAGDGGFALAGLPYRCDFLSFLAAKNKSAPLISKAIAKMSYITILSSELPPIEWIQS